MSLRTAILLGSILGLLAACTGRHVVTEREVGRVDVNRSITNDSDLRWTIERKPVTRRNEGG